MVMSNDELKGKLYELGTVDIRSVLRILNNTVAKTVEGAQLAAMKHEAAFRVILDEYLNKPARCGPEAVENAYLKVIEAPNAPERKSELPPPPWEEPRPTRVETPSEPRKPKTREEMLAELLAAPSLDVTQVNALIAAHPNVKNFNEFCDAQLNINESVGTSITHIHEQYDSVKADVDVLTSRIEKDRETVAQTRQEMLDIIKKSNAVSLTITFLDDKPAVDLGIVHRDTPRLIKYLAAGCHVFLPGPAGSGKSTAAEQAALALGLNFYATSASASRPPRPSSWAIWMPVDTITARNTEKRSRTVDSFSSTKSTPAIPTSWRCSTPACQIAGARSRTRWSGATPSSAASRLVTLGARGAPSSTSAATPSTRRR
jgi:hypothetical protein